MLSVALWAILMLVCMGVLLWYGVTAFYVIQAQEPDQSPFEDDWRVVFRGKGCE